MFRAFLVLLSVATLSLTTLGCKSPENWPGGLLFDRVLIVVLENTNYSTAIREPYLRDLASQGTLFSNFHGVIHPSYQNYLALVGGRLFFTLGGRQRTLNAPSVVDLIEKRGLTWKNYAEGYPGNCFLGSQEGHYVRRHVPFLSFKSIQEHPERCARVVPAQQFDQDRASGQLPNFMLYTPNMDNTGHDTGVGFASLWLKSFLDPLLADASFMERTLVVVTFDESRDYWHNHIYTLFLGPMVKQGFVDAERYSLYHLLRTVEDNFGLGTLSIGDGGADPVLSAWTENSIEDAKARFQ